MLQYISIMTQYESTPALIFIHGFRGSHLGLTPIMRFLQDYQIYAPDLPPFGNAGTLEEYTSDTYADYVIHFIRQQKLIQPILIGHSMGSIISAAIAEKYPDEINHRLIFTSPIPEKTSRFFASLQPFVTIFPNNILSFISTRFFFIPKNRQLYKKALQMTRLSGANFANRQDIKKVAHFSATTAISDFTFQKDVLLISGDHDRLVPQNSTKALAKKLHAQLVFVKNSGHLLNYESPEIVANFIRNFISS